MCDSSIQRRGQLAASLSLQQSKLGRPGRSEFLSLTYTNTAIRDDS